MMQFGVRELRDDPSGSGSEGSKKFKIEIGWRD